jgi:zinc protease
LWIQRWKLGNGLTVLLLRDPSAPVISYQTWLRVGSSHERPGKTGLAHLLEHLMFHATQRFAEHEFDRLIESAGGEANAATWVDWTSYYDNLPASELALAVRLESDRLVNVLLAGDEVASEKEIVASERRDRVEDDLEGAVGEILYATAFGRRHPYSWPTIGWMEDIRSLTPADCRAFYRTYYAPNMATIVLVGHFETEEALSLIQDHYGDIPPSRVPPFQPPPAPRQRGERRCKLEWPTRTSRIAVGWHAPPYATFEHAVLGILEQLLVGGRSSRLWRELVVEREMASEVRMSLAPFRFASLVELWISAREGHSARRCLTIVGNHLRRLQKELVSEEELAKAKNRIELSFLGALETVAGKAEQIGFSEAVVGDPRHGFERLAQYRRVRPEDVRRVAGRVFDDRRRTVIEVHPTLRRSSPERGSVLRRVAARSAS